MAELIYPKDPNPIMVLLNELKTTELELIYPKDPRPTKLLVSCVELIYPEDPRPITVLFNTAVKIALDI